MSKLKVGMTAQEITEKWQRRTTAAVPDAVAGVQRVTDSPMEAAANQESKMLQNITKAVTSGRWAAGLRAVPLETWKSVTAKKIQERMGGGVAAATAKRGKFDAYMVNTVNSILPTIKDMPDMTIEDSIARVGTFMRHMNENPYKATR